MLVVDSHCYQWPWSDAFKVTRVK